MNRKQNVDSDKSGKTRMVRVIDPDSPEGEEFRARLNWMVCTNLYSEMPLRPKVGKPED